MVQGQVFLIRGAGTFDNLFFQCLSFLHLEIILLFAKLCYAFEEKRFFFCHHNFMKKVILSYLKMNQKISNNQDNLIYL